MIYGLIIVTALIAFVILLASEAKRRTAENLDPERLTDLHVTG